MTALLTLGPAHVAAAGRLCEDAFVDYRLVTALFPGDEAARRRVIRPLYTAIVADCTRHGVVHGVVDDGRIVGVAAWLAPGAYPRGWLRDLRDLPGMLAALRHFPERTRPGLQVTQRIERRHPDVPAHWYLATVAVAPAQQGEGIGGGLLRPMLRMLDATGAPAFLETSEPSNQRWYERLGFRVLSEQAAFDGGPAQWAMWREPDAEGRAEPGT